MREPFDVATSDRVLVQLIGRDRSEAAFSALYDRHTPRAFQTAWRILGGADHEVEDVSIDVWSGIPVESTVDSAGNLTIYIGQSAVLVHLHPPPHGQPGPRGGGGGGAEE